MKWKEMTTVRKVITVTGFLCFLAHLVLDALDRADLLTVSEAILDALSGIGYLTFGTCMEGRDVKITFCILGCWCFFTCFWHLVSML